MIHFLTVHWKHDFWVTVQHEAIRATTKAPFMHHAVVDGEVDSSFRGDRAVFQTWLLSDETSHAVKLDLLAEVVAGLSRSPKDLLIFIDSDAIPLPGWEVEIGRLMQTHDVVAMERREFGGDDFSHPAFCVMSMHHWLEVGGRWADRSPWRNSNGNVVTKVGGGLTRKILDHGLTRAAMVRSNRLELFPPFFAVYGDVVYHHTAGSYPKQAHRNLGQVSSSAANVLGVMRLVAWVMEHAVATRPWSTLFVVDSYVKTAISKSPSWPVQLLSQSWLIRFQISLELVWTMLKRRLRTF